MGFFLLPFLTPHLSKTDFGVWGTIVAYSLIFSSARDLGMVVPMFNSYYKHPTRWIWVWRQVIWYLLLWGIVIAIFQSLLLYVVIPDEALSDRPEIILLLAVQCVFFDVPILIGSRYYQAAEKPFAISIVSILSGFIAVGGQYYFIAVKSMGYMGWFYATFSSLAIMAFIYAVLLYKMRLIPLARIRLRWAAARFKVALPMVPHSYSAYMLNASDRVMLSAFNTPISQIGLYNVAYMWGNYLEVIGNSIGMAVGPIYLKLYNEPQNSGLLIAKRITILLQLLFIVGSFIVSLWSKELFTIFIRNQSLTEAYSLAIIIVMSYSYRPLYWSVITKLQFDEKTSKLWRISFAAGAINILLNFIFIPLYGFQAAAYTTFVAMMYQGFAGYFLKNQNHSFNRFELLFWFIFIIIATTMAFSLREVSIEIKFILTCAILLVVFIWGFRFSKKIKV